MWPPRCGVLGKNYSVKYRESRPDVAGESRDSPHRRRTSRLFEPGTRVAYGFTRMDRRLPTSRGGAPPVPVTSDGRAGTREAPPFDAQSLLRHLRPYLMGATVLPVIAALYWGQG